MNVTQDTVEKNARLRVYNLVAAVPYLVDYVIARHDEGSSWQEIMRDLDSMMQRKTLPW